MRVLFSIHRFAPELSGGAEAACRAFATGLAVRGHDVHVVTSRATSYLDWADVLPAGGSEDTGVTVHRLSVRAPRDLHRFAALSTRAFGSRHVPPPALQRAWLEAQGPDLAGLDEWIDAHAGGFDVVVAFTYLYAPAVTLLERVAGRVPVLFHPTAHDEPPLGLPRFDRCFRLADGFGFFTEEEQALVEARFRLRPDAPRAVLGIPIDPEPAPVDLALVPAELRERPYLVCVGRIDPSKGTPELVDWFRAYKAAEPGPAALVLIGERAVELPEHRDVVVLGYVDDATRRAVVAGACGLVHPGRLESFSMVLMEGWAQGVAAAIRGDSPVLAGHARRSGGALLFSDAASFAVAAGVLLHDAERRGELAAAGRRYVEERFDPGAVLDRYEALLGAVVAAARERRVRAGRGR